MQLCGKEPGSHRRLALQGEKFAMGRAASQIIVNLWEEGNGDDADEQEVWIYEKNVRHSVVRCAFPFPFHSVLTVVFGLFNLSCVLQSFLPVNLSCGWCRLGHSLTRPRCPCLRVRYSAIP